MFFRSHLFVGDERLAILKYSVADVVPHLNPELGSESNVLHFFLVVVTAIRSFNGVRKGNIQLPQEDGPSSSLLKRRDPEDAAVVAEHFSVASEHAWKYLGLVVVAICDWKFRPVHEHVLLDGVAVEVQK